MSIEKKLFGDSELLVKPIGRLDVNSIAEFEEIINSEIDNIKYLTIDLSEVNYISSIGLRTIIAFHKKMCCSKGEMKVANVKPEIMEIFKTVGFDNFLSII
ncbi:STAS domain-containing protein [bacterium]|nr:STAS domain-containing protein [bacterium]